ncbi:hypothetical protein [uncultured Mediterranean phage]|nr:hypothetical protein [uncultured Mediterranean phage]
MALRKQHGVQKPLQGARIAEDTETAEFDGEEESEEDSGEPEPPKAVSKLLKQVNKLTARAKAAEEATEAMKAEISNLKSQPAEEANKGQLALEDIGNLKDLEKLRLEAVSAKKFALQHIGKDFVEVDGTEYEDQQIRNILFEAEDYLTEKIPQRAAFLNRRQQWVADTNTTFPWLADPESPEYELYLEIRGGDEYSKILDQLPNGEFVAATLVKGIQAVKAEQAAAAKPKAKKAKTPPPTDAGDAAPPASTKDSRQAKKRKAALGTGAISEDQLATYLTT